MAQARGRYLGMDLELISASEAKKLFPSWRRNTLSVRSTIRSRVMVIPYGVTHAYAKSAQLVARRSSGTHGSLI